MAEREGRSFEGKRQRDKRKGNVVKLKYETWNHYTTKLTIFKKRSRRKDERGAVTC